MAKLVNSGATVIGIDLLYQGEFLADGKPLTRTPRVKNPREAGAYTFGYNHALFVHRVHDVLSVVKFAKSRGDAAQRLTVVGLDGAGPWVAAARAQCGEAIDQAVIDTGGFRFGKVLDLSRSKFSSGWREVWRLAGVARARCAGPDLGGRRKRGRTRFSPIAISGGERDEKPDALRRRRSASPHRSVAMDADGKREVRNGRSRRRMPGPSHHSVMSGLVPRMKG